MKTQVDRGDEIPLYKQISQAVCAEIEKGNLKKGMRLPSEAAMAEVKQVAVGTVKRAYADLEAEGHIYKIRGGGAYVSGDMNASEEIKSSEGTPEEIVARTVRELSQSGLHMDRIFSIIQKQSEQVFRRDERIKAALVDCNFETLHNVMGDLEQIPYLEVEPFLLEELLSGEKVIGSQYSLALVSQKHFGEFIRYADSIHLRTEEISLRESRGTVARLAVIPDGQEICILYRSREFLESVQYTLKWLDKKNKLICIEEQQFTKEDETYIEAKLPLVIPPDYMDYSSARILQMIGRARKVGSLLITFEFEIDKGSLLHLKRTLENIQTREAELGI
ncbi:MAG: GntR family transcriptional regulator [Clostridium sp.]